MLIRVEVANASWQSSTSATRLTAVLGAMASSMFRYPQLYTQATVPKSLMDPVATARLMVDHSMIRVTDRSVNHVPETLACILGGAMCEAFKYLFILSYW